MTNIKQNQEKKRPPLNFDAIRAAAVGNWTDRIFPAVGINLRAPYNRHQPCPLCGGTDRFRCDNKDGRGTSICSQCGARDGEQLVRDYLGMDNYDTMNEIASALGMDATVTMSDAERQKLQAERRAMIQAQKERETQERRQAQIATARIAQGEWSSARPADSHAYLERKMVRSHGLRIDAQGNLLIPLYYHRSDDKVTLVNRQSISADGTKLFLKGGLKGETWFTLGKPNDGDVIFVAEGYATAASIYESFDCTHPVIMTIDAGNMVKCAPKLRTLYPHSTLIFAADDDRATELKTGTNPGITKANEAASLAGGYVAVPNFGNDGRRETGELTDYNDLHVHFSLSDVADQLSHIIDAIEMGLMDAAPAQIDNDDQAISDEPTVTPEPTDDDTSDAQADDVYEYTSDNIFSDFAIIVDNTKRSATNKIYNLNTKYEYTKTQFETLVGKKLAKEWFDRAGTKSITREQVRKNADDANRDSMSWMFDNYWYIAGTKEVFNHESRQRQPIETLRLEFPNEFDLWQKSEHRQKVKSENIWFDPTMTKQPPKAENYINTFDELPLRAFSQQERKEKGITDDIIEAWSEPFIALLRHLCEGEGEEAIDWVLNWLALPLQKPGTKLDTALLFHGHIQGAGKSLFFDRVLSKIYGDYLLTLGQGQLDSQYNDWVEGKLFAVFEEIFQGRERYSQMGMIKQMITGKDVYINKKFVSGWRADSYVNVVFLSNDLQPLALEDNDRRHMVFYPKSEIPLNIQHAVADAIKDPNLICLRGFMTYLLNKDLGGFTAQTKPLKTAARERLINLSRSSWERFYSEWQYGKLDAPYSTCLSTDLYEFYKAWCQKNGERPTSAAKLLTFIGVRERKEIVWYRYHVDLTWGGASEKERKEIKKQGTVIIIDEPTDNGGALIDARGEQILAFKKAISKYLLSTSAQKAP
ncbi:DUF5906 domain-containing protein [Moraxella bovoculi]|uniref:DUF5906 domain-containing protein n=1 Tax=Moraxella bovoculi TaxID=386891 RepID=UPI00072F5EE0|nr:DUF5906 domain-containing protein [Moraxella bovoculi]AKG16274.2 hypothetical protein AAX08_06440 [Moraxella bovoculi]